MLLETRDLIARRLVAVQSITSEYKPYCLNTKSPLHDCVYGVFSGCLQSFASCESTHSHAPACQHAYTHTCTRTHTHACIPLSTHTEWLLNRTLVFLQRGYYAYLPLLTTHSFPIHKCVHFLVVSSPSFITLSLSIACAFFSPVYVWSLS